jgi:hypothetical protein
MSRTSPLPPCLFAAPFPPERSSESCYRARNTSLTERDAEEGGEAHQSVMTTPVTLKLASIPSFATRT